MAGATALERVLRRDRWIVLGGISAVVLLAAIYTVAGVGMGMSALTMTRMAVEMPGMAMMPAVWSPGYALAVFLMWWVMMVAMMIPSAAPAILLFAAGARRRVVSRSPHGATSAFVFGYLAVWGAFSAAATALQWGLESIGLVTGMMEIASGPIAGTVLVAAGLYQLTPLKEACLKHCQHPLLFLLHHWRPGAIGAFRMGLEHGAFCLGCCWFLMALLFVGGIMNLIWIAGIALYVALEKIAANRRWFTTCAGWTLVVAGGLLLARPHLAI
jgi:predicted metal-binding membrane protein